MKLKNRRNLTPEFAVIGLGRFGASLAAGLIDHGCNVLGIDQNRHIVQSLADELTHVVSLDATDEDALRAVDITSFDTVIVAIGTNFEANLMTTLALKSLGVRNIICKALTERQRTALLAVGANRVVLPEHESAHRLAHALTAPSILEELAVDSRHSISELRVPAAFAGQTLRNLDIRSAYGVTVVAVKRGDDLLVSPPSDYEFSGEDIMVVIGENNRIAVLSENQ